MTHRNNLHRLGILVAFVAAVTIAAVLPSGLASARATTITGGTWSFSAGSKSNVVQVKLTGVPAAGLGAADISVAVNAAVLKVVSCTSGDLEGACNPNSPGGPARAAGFKAPAIATEPVVIGSITLDCIGAAGSSSALTITVNDLVDGTAGNPQAVSASVQNGTVTCGTAPSPPQSVATPVATTPGSLPSTGGNGPSGFAWPLALAAALGLAVFGSGAMFAARRLGRRT